MNLRWLVWCVPCLLLAACGGDEPAPSVEALLADGQAAFQRGEDAVMAARTEAEFDAALEGYSEAVAGWMEAASAWRKAFRMIDPTDEEKSRRTMLSFRIARAFAKAARHGRDPDWASLRADHAFIWFDQTARLAPGMRQVHYERARLFDSEIESVRDLVAAHGAYMKYLALVDFDSNTIPESEQERVKHARSRAMALAPPKGG